MTLPKTIEIRCSMKAKVALNGMRSTRAWTCNHNNIRNLIIKDVGRGYKANHIIVAFACTLISFLALSSIHTLRFYSCFTGFSSYTSSDHTST